MHRAYNFLLSKRFEIMEKLYTRKIFLKMAGGRMHTPHLTPLDLPLAISYINHQKSLACFSHLTPLIVFFFTKRRSRKGDYGTIPSQIRSCRQLYVFVCLASCWLSWWLRASLSMQEVLGLIPWPVKSSTVSPALRCFFGAVLPRR